MAIKEATKKIYLTDDGQEHESLEKAKRHELFVNLHDCISKRSDRDFDEVAYSASCVVELIIANVDEINEIIQKYKFQPHDTVPPEDG